MFLNSQDLKMVADCLKQNDNYLACSNEIKVVQQRAERIFSKILNIEKVRHFND